MASAEAGSPTGATKRRKLPACDPCRFAKMACDHGQPICARCVERDRADSCIYRSRPFKKRIDCLARPTSMLAQPDHQPQAPENTYPTTNTVSCFLDRPHVYPNPGYLGRSSHTTLFGHLSPDQDGIRSAINKQRADKPGQLTNEVQLTRGVDLVSQLYEFPHLPACVKLVKTWLATGANLALAAAFTEHCTLTAEHLLLDTPNRLNAAELCPNLFRFSCLPLDVNASTTLETFCTQFTQDNPRWETLAFFCICVSRALLACRSWTMPPFHNSQERRRIQTLFMHFADRCIDICLSLDCLNDLHLVLQYESFILHSLINGDQSFETWRKLGDLVSCLLALGYHEEIDSDSLPSFVKSLRQTAYAYCYTADKNMSIFLGRPPRIHPKFCRFHVAELNTDGQTENGASSPPWSADKPFDFQADAWWSAICAAIKEEILYLSSSENSSQRRLQRTRLILTEAQARWESLPSHFRLEGRLKSCERTSLEIDLLLEARLNYLHILFLSRLTLKRNIFESDDELFAIASEMFELVIEAVMLRDKVAHGSTSLIWKVVYYGLASAGAICLSLLQPSFVHGQHVSVRFKIFQNLAILVAEVESGTLVAPEDANYALLASATQTITSVLQRLLSGRSEHPRLSSQAASRDATPQPPVAPADEPWSPWRDSSFQDFETNFWHTLAEHPFLVGDEAYLHPM